MESRWLAEGEHVRGSWTDSSRTQCGLVSAVQWRTASRTRRITKRTCKAFGYCREKRGEQRRTLFVIQSWWATRDRRSMMTALVLCVTAVLMVVVGNAHGRVVEFYGSAEGFNVFLNEHGACVAEKQVQYTDIDGAEYTAGIVFGIVRTGAEEFSMLGIYSPSFEMNYGESRWGTVAFDGQEVDVFYVADGEQLLTAYMDIEGVLDVMEAYTAEVNLFDGTFIEVPLSGTMAAGNLIGDCYERELMQPRGDHNPLR